MADTPTNEPDAAPDRPVEELPVGRWDRPSRWDECRFDPDEEEGD